ncbi:hypothetical protein C1645_743524 [Glomus cerebriforme]|uniref:DUF8211 domain-containing protein n=1 Tax=Glomus cerebriforme TaxID=658196 RepID=A0A397SBD5_9GLOM|nr:hypothetical protein C1645_743524 [Glomus cerebriforme]
MDQHPCPLPSLIIMSNNRTGCTLHQKHFHVTDSSRNNLPLSARDATAKHAAAATHTFNEWSSLTPKFIHSNRRGISYTSRIKTPNDNGHKPHYNSRIYAKEIKNYKIITATGLSHYTARTLKKQEKRRTHLKNLLFSLKPLPRIEKPSATYKNYMLHLSHTLFQNNHRIFKPIDHITWKKFRNKPIKTFPLPLHCLRHTHRMDIFNSQQPQNGTASSSRTSTDPSPSSETVPKLSNKEKKARWIRNHLARGGKLGTQTGSFTHLAYSSPNGYAAYRNSNSRS